MPRTATVIIASLFCLLSFLFIMACAFARNDDGRYNDNPLRPWFDSLKNQKNFPCCSTVDGTRLEDPDWRIENDGSYSVRLDGQWLAVPPEAVITEKNRAGYVVVWRFNGKITCFLGGNLT